jgi:hypothetical protein
MSFPGPGRGRGPDSGNNHVVMSAGRGAVLVAVAVIVGLLVLATVRDAKSSGSAADTTETTAPVVTSPAVTPTNLDGSPAVTSVTTAGTTVTTKAKKSTTTTAKGDSGSKPRDNSQVVVQVLNGSGISQAATTKTNDLKAKGYQTVGAGNATQQTGTTVQCKAGYEKEATQLVTELGGLGTPATVQPIANPLPTGFDPIANCYVILGK